MANPRKFSEKIALHNQKQAEETAAFEQIMKEVIGATRVSKLNVFLHIKALKEIFQYTLYIHDGVCLCIRGTMLSQHWISLY